MVKVMNNSPSLIGRYKSMGLTFYRRGNEIVARSSYKEQPSFQTTPQFRSRERVRRIISLWNCFTTWSRIRMTTSDGLSPYKAFLRLNTKLTPTYLTRQQHTSKGALLVPGLCISAGRLDPLSYEFETLPDGRRLVVTDIKTGFDPDLTQSIEPFSHKSIRDMLLKAHNGNIHFGDMLRFYHLRQTVEERFSGPVPKVIVSCCNILLDGETDPRNFLKGHELYTHRGFLAIAGADDPDSAYAVSLFEPAHQWASTQYIITTSRFYEDYATEEALNRAIESYGNVRDESMKPDVEPRGHNLVANE